MASIQLLSIDDPRMTAPRKHDWQDRALCAEVGLEAFFPNKGGDTGPAKKLCDACPVPLTCLNYAMLAEAPSNEGDNARHGIFGGLAPRERKALADLFEKNPSLTLEEGVEEIKSRRKQKGNPKLRKAA